MSDATALKKVEPERLPATERAAIFSMIERVSADPTVSVERVDQLFSLYQRMQADQARKDFTVALVAAQGEMEPVRKNANNPQTKSRYATFEALDAAARPIYSTHGFAPTYRTEASDKPDYVRVVLTLMHASGHERDYPIDMPADGKGAKGGDVMTKTHAVGSAFSYGKRYALGGAFNIITTEKDDDGNAAGNAQPENRAEKLEELNKLAKELGVTDAFLCEYYSVGAKDDLSIGQIKEAIAGLMARKRKQGGAK